MEYEGQVPFILKQLHTGGFKDAIVAGGAVRDGLLGKEIKDIDVLISYKDYKNNVGTGSTAFEACLFRPVTMMNWSMYFETPDVHLVFEMEQRAGELPVQLIVLKEGMIPKERLDMHDFGLCQVGWDGNSICMTEAYAIDVKQKTFTLIYCENQHEFDRSIRRYERLMKKFPDYSLVITDKHTRYMGLPS